MRHACKTTVLSSVWGDASCVNEACVQNNSAELRTAACGKTAWLQKLRVATTQSTRSDLQVVAVLLRDLVLQSGGCGGERLDAIGWHGLKVILRQQHWLLAVRQLHLPTL